MTAKPKDQEKDEDARRRDEVLARMLKTPHKPHKEGKIGEAEASPSARHEK